MIALGSVPFCSSWNTSIWFWCVLSTPAWHAATPFPGTTTACTPMRNWSSRSTHVAEAMTTRPVLRATAITDQVASAGAGSRQTSRALHTIRRIKTLLSTKECGSYRRLAARGDFDLDAHARVGQAGGHHRRGGPHVAEVLAQRRPAPREVRGVWQDVTHADDISEPRARFLERRLNVTQALLRLRHYIVRDRHRRVVEAGGARNEHPLAVDHRARVADLFFEGRSRADQSPVHDISSRDAVCTCACTDCTLGYNAPVTDRFALLRNATAAALLRSPGATPDTLRQAVAAGLPPPDLTTLVEKIRARAYTVTDRDLDALWTQYTDEQLFEVIVAAAFGAAQEQLAAAHRALEDA